MCEAHTKHRRHFKRTGKMGSKSSTAQLDRGCLLSFTVTEVMLRFGGVSIVGAAAAIFRICKGFLFIHNVMFPWTGEGHNIFISRQF